MSDGTTAVQVSPIPTEQDMNTFRSIMDRALNSIVQASELAKTVEALKVEVEGFKQDLEILRSRNKDLDEMLTHVRAQRDEAERKLSVVQYDLEDTQRDKELAVNSLSISNSEINRLKAENASLIAQRNDWSNKWADESSKREAAEAKLTDIQEFAQRLFPAKVEPKPEAMTEAQATQVHRVYDGDVGFTWDKPTVWDSERNRYYNEAA